MAANRIVARVELSGDESVLVLRDGGLERARIEFALRASPRLHLPGRTALELVKYAPGWHLALVDPERPEAPLAWYAGGGGFGGGRVTFAPDREYRIRTRFPLGTVWRLQEGRARLAVLRARRRFPEPLFELEVGDPPAHGPDAELLHGLLCAVVALSMRTPVLGGGGAGAGP